MSLMLVGTFTYELWDGDECIARDRVRNGITTEGIENLFDTYFKNGSVAAAWYLGLVASTDFDEADDETDIMSSHPGWVELTAEYDEAARPAWGPDSSASQTIANSVKVIFTMNAATTVRGFFVTSSNTKGGTTGQLWSTAILDTVQSVQPGQQLKVVYSLLGQEG